MVQNRWRTLRGYSQAGQRKIDIPYRLGPYAGHLQLNCLSILYIGQLGSEEFDHKLKEFTSHCEVVKQC